MLPHFDFWFIVLVSIIVYLIIKLNKQAILQIPPKFDIKPENVIFAFDLHQVVVHPNHFEMFRLLFVTESGRRFLAEFLNPQVFLATARVCGSFFWYNFTQKKGIVVEELFYLLADKFPNIARHTNFFTIVSNCFDPDPVTLDVIKQLRKQNYKILLISNIGSRFMEDMKKKYSFFNECFDEFYCASHLDGYLKKPNLGYYDLFITRHCNGNNCQVVFVDDKVANLQASLDCKHGHRFYPLFFKNSVQFQKQIYNWGFLEPASTKTD